VIEEDERRLTPGRLGPQHRDARERRPIRLFALDERRRCEGVVAAMHQLLQQRVPRIFRLDQHLAGFFGASGPSGHLDDRLRQSFGRAEISHPSPFSFQAASISRFAAAARKAERLM